MKPVTLRGVVGMLMGMALALPAARAHAAPQGLISRTTRAVVIDGKLDEWAGAFATPVNAGHADWANRAAVFYYLWDDQNLYIGLHSLDGNIFNTSPGPIYNGDGVEFYLDTREKPTAEWQPGALHLFFTPASNDEIKPRVQIRGGIPAFKDVTTEGMEIAAIRTREGYTLEFKLPWSKLNGFKPTTGREIGIDCELTSSDSGPRIDRCWVYSGVAAVGNPSVIGRVRLVDTWDPADAATYSTALFPTFLARSSPANEPATLFVGISPSLQSLVRRIDLTIGTRPLQLIVGRPYGPGWLRAQCGLVGFTNPEDKELTVKILGDGNRVLGIRTLPLK